MQRDVLTDAHTDSYLAGQTHYRTYNAMPIISDLNVILTSFPKRMAIISWRNQYFSRPTAEPFRLGGVDVWKGLCSSVRPVYKQLMIKANVCITAFHIPRSLVLAMMEFERASLGAQMNRFFLGVRIETHLGHRRIIKSFASQTARTYSFDVPGYGWVTMEEYFRRSECPYFCLLAFF